MKKAFRWNKVTIYGSAASEIGVVDYVLLLTEKPDITPPKISYIGLPKKLVSGMPKIREPRVIHAPIKDFAAPGISAHIYEQIVRKIAAYHKDKPVSLCVACAGGLGRTGTVLAALAYLLGVTKNDPVLYIRKVYQRAAVETESQIKWLESELRIKIKSEPAKSSWVQVTASGTKGVVSGTTLQLESKQPPVFGFRSQKNEPDIDW